MVIVSVGGGHGDSGGGGGGGGGGKEGTQGHDGPTLAHYPQHYNASYPPASAQYPPPPAKFAQHRDYPVGYDSDSNSDHSSSGRGSGGSDVGSEVDRDGSRLEDSGRYSADGCESISSPQISEKPHLAPHIENTTEVNSPSKAQAKNVIDAATASASASQVTIKHTQPQHKGLSAHKQEIRHGPSSPAHSIHLTTQSKVVSGGKNGQEVAVTHSRSSRSVPVTHPPVDAPLCNQCNRRGLFFFDPGCSGCSTLLRRPTTSPSHVFAVMRQWVPQVQHNIHQLVAQAMSLGCHVDDRDGLSDMTLLQYAVKAGSNGVGDPAMALKVVMELLGDGADVHQRCRWTHMTALHYAAYFDVSPVLDLLLSDPKGVCINDACLEYSGGTPLHIAAANLCLAATRVLLKHGALLNLTDTQGRTPFQCIPTPDQYELVPDVQNVIAQLRSQLSPSASHCYKTYDYSTHASSQGLSGRAVLKAMGLKLGDRVLVSGVKTGTLRFVGSTEFATGLWAGVELETPTGRHNGTVKGVMYFRCANNYGIFVPVNRLTKIPNVCGSRQGRSTSVAQRQRANNSSRRSMSLPPGRVNHGRVDVSRVSSRVAQDIRNTNRKILIGDRVYVDMGLGNGSSRAVMGAVKYTGGVHFASGFWIGVELDVPRGTNDGSVNGTRYFSCRPHCGIFAATSRVIKISGDSESDEGTEAPSEPASLSYSRYSLSSGHGSNNNILSSNGPMSLGCPTTMSNSNHGPMSLGSNATMNGSYSNAMCSSMTDSCTNCVSSQHLLDSYGEGALKRAHSLKTAIYPSNTAMTSLNRSFSARLLPQLLQKRYVSSRQRQEELERASEERKKEQTWCDPPVLPTPKTQKKKQENQHWLEPGHNVFYKNEVGVIKYIGFVDFEPGMWIGIELRAAKGRHDGVVKGKRYYTCKHRHGIMVRPSKVYVRGINGAKLVKPENEFEE